MNKILFIFLCFLGLTLTIRVSHKNEAQAKDASLTFDPKDPEYIIDLH